MRHVTLRFFTLLTLSAAAFNCGQAASPSGGLVPGESGFGGGKVPSDGVATAGASGAGGSTGGDASKAQGTGGAPANTPPSSAATTSSSAGGAGLGPQVVGCEVPADPASTTTIYMSVPNANWFSAATQARAMLKKGLAPIPSLVRDGDFLAYYATRYTVANDPNSGSKALSIVPLLGAGSSPVQSIVQIGVQAAGVDPKLRPAASITFLLDTSISMEGPSMTLAHEAMKAITENLVQGDVVNLVTTLPGATPQKFTLAKALDPTVIGALEKATADGGDDIPGALVKAYDQAKKSYVKGGLNRVVFISDGGALPTVIDAGLVAANALPGAQGDIRLVGVGTGSEPGYNPALLERAAGPGRGALVYLNEVGDADAELGVRFDEVLGLTATDVKLELSFPWYFAPDDVQNGEFASDPSEIVATDLGPGGSLSFRQLLRVCNPEIIQQSDAINATVTWISPTDSSQQSVSAKAEIVGLLNQTSHEVLKGTAILAYTEALRTLDPKRLQHALDLASAQPNDPDLVEIAALIQKHPAFSSPAP